MRICQDEKDILSDRNVNFFIFYENLHLDDQNYLIFRRNITDAIFIVFANRVHQCSRYCSWYRKSPIERAYDTFFDERHRETMLCSQNRLLSITFDFSTTLIAIWRLLYYTVRYLVWCFSFLRKKSLLVLATALKAQRIMHDDRVCDKPYQVCVVIFHVIILL